MGEARLKSGFVRRLWLARAHPPSGQPDGRPQNGTRIDDARRERGSERQTG